MFNKVLIANRGEIACRIIRTLDRMGVASVAVYSEADAHALHTRLAGEAMPIGPAPASQSYLDTDKILEVAAQTGAQAVHPGYGFLSENAGFAERLAEAGIAFIGPTPDQLRAFGLKHEARALAEAAGVPLVPGSPLLASFAEAKRAAEQIGYPVMLKSTAGGGGIGLMLCRDETELAKNLEAVERLGKSNFGEGGAFLEKYIAHARHIEVQIFGDGKGGVITLGERDCSVQRRNQKVIEETPAPDLPETVRNALHEAARKLGESVSYASAGTVEFIYDADAKAFYFLEVNTRLQVEHGVTEEVTGLDLVDLMVRQAAGELPPLSDYAVVPSGASMEARIYAEDPGKDFQPSAGLITEAVFPETARIDGWIEAGTEVPSLYDPMLAKVIVFGKTREEARTKLAAALAETQIGGIETNLDYLKAIAASDGFAAGGVTTGFLATFETAMPRIDVASPGGETTVQDYPGRLNYWGVGVPPSGPMDTLSHRLLNRAVGNSERAACLEMALSGPSLRFGSAAVFAFGGAPIEATLNGEPVAPWQPHHAKEGDVLALGKIGDRGRRAYLAIRGGIDVPDYLNSKATFRLGKFGGHAGRPLKAGDVLHIGQDSETPPQSVPEALRPAIPNQWEIGVLYGPHGAPDYFTPGDIETLFATDYEVHFNSDRTGVRLIGPKPEWARDDGGEAGLHPSNIHDNAYAVGAIDFTGDMPILLGPDGPSLGGFVCPAVTSLAEIWKLGQLRAGDKLRFRPMSEQQAAEALEVQDAAIAQLAPPAIATPNLNQTELGEAVLHRIDDAEIPVVYRRTGDDNILVEYGSPVLDIALRLRAQMLMEAIEREGLKGVIDLTPGVRSLQVHFDPRALGIRDMLAALIALEAGLPPTGEITLPTRIVHMPLSWDDEAIHLIIQRYQELVRPDAPWCPSNIEFIRRINGLESIEEVKRIVFEASYLVLGLGDVYLGAPLATPLDPRHRLVTTKYNPARTWTLDNVVGIGGAYMCIYGMEGPGGYQLFGRTVPVWRTYRQTGAFEPGTPWLLRFFDQVRFFPVSHDELMERREAMSRGEAELEIEETEFSFPAYNRFLAENAESIEAFRTTQRQAFTEERERWKEAGIATYAAEPDVAPEPEEEAPLLDGASAVFSPMPGNVWEIPVEEGTRIEKGEALVILESMKMEVAVEAEISGEVIEIRCAKGRTVGQGDVLIVLKEDT
ncbi:urea carboxylase [Methyloligella sp. 2.7D]|uniref:urea carboxylase n=1 Tax=unclassified Methyloligella TaxID=2625955 RepID=UPI00157C00CE|nr:urea carboxylase [Methyloligella sp. GL2]QKP76905.1 urea carboxylase [Methyloligella sp. GL2]